MKIEQKENIQKIFGIIKSKINSCKNNEDKKKTIMNFADKIIESKDEYLCFEFAKEYGASLGIDNLYKISDIILKSKNPYLCTFFPKYFELKNFNKFVKVIKNSPVFYILNFLRTFPNFNANYFAEEILQKGNVEQNIDYVYEFDIDDIIPHSIKIAKEGTAKQNLNYIIGIDSIFETYPEEAISKNVENIISSGDANIDFNYVMMFKPQKDLEKHAKVIADSDDLLLNYLACNNWPDQDPLELAMFTKVIHNHTKAELENRLIFRLRILDKDSRRKIISKYFDIKTEKSNQEFENESEKD